MPIPEPAPADRPRLLVVDDEPAVVESLAAILRRQFRVSTATSGAAGLESLGGEPFAVVLSDMRMPGMDGAVFLARVRQRAPDTTRVLLTGYADVSAAIAAVNDGHVFRFLTKPCPPDVLIPALRAAADQHRLVTGERELLEKTLQGAVKALGEALALANPAAFGRTARLRTLVGRLCDELKVKDRWVVEVATSLSQLGAVTLPPDTAERYYHGVPLSTAEWAMVARMPGVATQILADIPRLEPVRDVLAHMQTRWDGTAAATPGPSRSALPIGARVLKVASDLDGLEARGLGSVEALDEMGRRNGWYDPQVLEAMRRLLNADAGVEERDLPLQDIREGMVFAQDVRTATGVLLVARGHPATRSLLDRLRNYGPALGLRGTLRILLEAPGGTDAP